MGLLDLQFCATLENLTHLKLPEHENWHFKIKCSNCNEEHQNLIYFNLQEMKDIEESKSKAHYYGKCSFCKREQTILFIASSYQPYMKSE